MCRLVPLFKPTKYSRHLFDKDLPCQYSAQPMWRPPRGSKQTSQPHLNSSKKPIYVLCPGGEIGRRCTGCASAANAGSIRAATRSGSKQTSLRHVNSSKKPIYVLCPGGEIGRRCTGCASAANAGSIRAATRSGSKQTSQPHLNSSKKPIYVLCPGGEIGRHASFRC